MKTILLVLISVVSVCCVRAGAETYYVRVGGNDSALGTSVDTAWATVEHAAEQVAPGDTVYVGAGTYAGQVEFEVSGTLAEPIRVVADIEGTRTGDAGAVVIEHGGTQPAIALRNAGYIYLSGFVVRGGEDGLLVDGGVGVEIDGFLLEDARDQGVNARGGAEVLLTNCTIRGTKRGVWIHTGIVRIEDSTLTELTQEGVLVRNTESEARLRRCRIIDVRRGAVSEHGRLALINTLIHDTIDEGVFSQNNSTLVMVHCTVDHAGGIGARFEGTATLYNNIISSPGSHCMQLDGGTVTASHTLVHDRPQLRSNNFNSLEFEFDPQYANPSGDDFSLSPESEAIDNGMDMTPYTLLDITGKDRPEGDESDLGAHEGSLPGRTYFVRTSGSDANDGLTPGAAFRTVQYAINQCTAPGSSVYVGPGNYQEALTIGTGSGINAVSGTRADPTRVIADIGGVNTLEDPGAVVLDGRDSSRTAIDARAISHWAFEGFQIRNYLTYGVYAPNAAVSLIACTIEVPSAYAYYALPGADVTIQDCTFDRNTGSGHGVWLWNIGNTGEIRLTVERNRMVSDSSDGTSWASGWSSWWISGYRSYRYGIIVANYSTAAGSAATVRNNLVTGMFLPIYTITRSSSAESEVVNNTVTDSFYSIYVYNLGGSVVAVNNLISNCYYGLFAYGGSPTIRGHAEHAITYNMDLLRRTYMPTDLITDSPMFADPDSGDYALQAGSPCADAGSSYHAPVDDLDGRARPADGDDDGERAYDIGALELVTGTSRRRVVRWREVSPIGEGD